MVGEAAQMASAKKWLDSSVSLLTTERRVDTCEPSVIDIDREKARIT